MKKYLEFRDEEIPEYNPNTKNDIFRVNGTKDTDVILIIGIIAAMFFIIAGLYYRDDISTIVICMLVGIIWFSMSIALLHSKHCARKKIIAEGEAYSAVIIRSFDYIKSIGTTHASTQKITEYGIEIKYAKGTREFTGYDGDAGKYLENLYCTVYEWNNRTIAADFKVRDKYISADGKSYSLKPVKK